MRIACSEGVANKEEGESLVEGELLKKAGHGGFLQIGRSLQDSTVRLPPKIRHRLQAEVHHKVKRPSGSRVASGAKDEEHHCLEKN